jgi:hypothetical protein
MLIIWALTSGFHILPLPFLIKCLLFNISSLIKNSLSNLIILVPYKGYSLKWSKIIFSHNLMPLKVTLKN